MSAERPSKDEIFNAAAEFVDAEERQAYINEVCGDDRQLREEIEHLLERDREAGSFLESPPPGLSPTTDQPITEKPGTQIGPYKLLQKVGEGGMGVVYMAEQKEPVKRRVALKIIKPGMDTRQVIARFEAERQALAMMDHPNIAKVLDAGQTESGRPYFVMELVKGISVTQYCDEQHLTPKERLELFVPICQAVQHAHQKGIIHRDIKPTNILVALFDGQPVSKVIDFGVAKATSQSLTEKTMFTQLGQVVGTLEYMSPEQAQVNQLDVDTRSDIYSLGVLLYELLTGDTPFDRQRLRSAAFDEMLRIIREEEPPKPSTKLSSSDTLPSIAAHRHVDPRRLTSAVRGELDWIVMKALEKDRARRYETASKFAEDVQHYLNDEPVVACPPSPSYRFHKFARRNKVALSTAAVVMVALLLGIAGTTWQAVRATRSEVIAQEALSQVRDQRDRAREAEERATEEAERAEAQRQQADANFQLARQAVDEYFTLVSENKLLEEPGLQPLCRELLEAAARFHESFVALRGDNPHVQADRAAAHLRLVGIYSMFGDAEKMLSEFEQGVKEAGRLLEDQPDAPDVHRRLSGFWKVRGNDGVLWRWIMSHPEAARKHLPIYEEAVQIWGEFARRNPGVDGFPADLSTFWGLIGAFHWSMGQRDEWVRSKRKVVEIREMLVRDYPEVVEHRAQLAHGYIGLCNSLQSTAPQEAVDLIRRAVEIRQDLVEKFPDTPEHRYWLGEHHHRLGGDAASRAVLSSEEREKHLHLALELFAKLAEEFPYEALYRERITRSHCSMANLLVRAGRTNEGMLEYRKAIELDPKHALSLNNLAWHLATAPDEEVRDPKEALVLARRAIEIDPKPWHFWNTLSVSAFRAGQWRESLTAREEKIRRKPIDVKDKLYLAMTHWQLKNQPEARKWFDEAIAELDRKTNPNAELLSLRQEAEQLLGASKQSGEARAKDP